MNLLLLIDSLQSGGAEMLVVHTANELAKRQINVHLITTEIGDGSLKKLLCAEIKYIHINCKGINFLNGVLKLKKYIQLNGITHVHAHLGNSIILSRLAVSKHVKLFATYHNMSYSPKTTYYSRWRVWIEKLTHRSRFTSIYVSNTVGKIVEGVRKSKPGKSFVLPNFSDTKIVPGYKYKDSNSIRLISIANLKKVKNLELAVEVLKDLTGFPIYWDIYGEGELRGPLQKRISETNSKIELKGFQQITNDVFSNYDLFAITSFDEGMPISLLEAMNFGLPSLLPEHIKVMEEVAGGSGYYFSIQRPDLVQQVLKDLLVNKRKLKEMSDIALERAKLFSADVHISNLLTIYNS